MNGDVSNWLVFGLVCSIVGLSTAGTVLIAWVAAWFEEYV